MTNHKPKPVPRQVTAYELLNAGYSPRGNYMIRELDDREIRFVKIAHGIYTYDGERRLEDEKTNT